MLQDGSLSRFEPPKKAKNSEQNKNRTYLNSDTWQKRFFYFVII